MKKFLSFFVLFELLLSVNVFAVSKDEISRFMDSNMKSHKINKKSIEIASSLVNGVEVIPRRGTPSAVRVYGENAFPFLLDSKGVPLMAYASYGKGHSIAMGNGSWLSSNKVLSDKSLSKLLDNCIKLSRGKRKKESNILVLRTKDLYKTLSKSYKVSNVNNLPESLDDFDILFCAIPTRGESYFDDDEVELIRDWVKKGGVFVGASSAWVFRSYGPGKRGTSVKTDFAGNKLFFPMGIIFETGYGRGSSYPVEKVSLDNIRFSNAHYSVVINNALERIKKNYFYSDYNESFYQNKLLYNMRSKIDIDTIFTKKEIMSILSIMKKNDFFPTMANHVSVLDARKTNLIILTDWILRSGKYNDPYFKKIAEDYPRISPDREVVSKKISLDCSESKWHSTGLWLNPFDTLVVKLPEDAISKRLKIQIGCHTDNIILGKKRTYWKRWPYISYTRSLKKSETSVVSPYGGLVYINVPRNCSGKFDIEISGASLSPLYVLGETSLSDWERDVQNLKSPLGEIEGKYCVITTDLSSLKKSGYNPKEIAEYWDKLIIITKELASTPMNKYKERYVIDRQIKAGSMHSGYPIFTMYSNKYNYEDLVLGFTTRRGNIFKNGCWGHFHELGHNNQNSDWTYKGSVEVTVNIFTLYALEKMVGLKPRDLNTIKKAQTRLDNYRKRGFKFSEVRKDLIVALLMYVELQEAFGWDSYKEVFRVYKSLDKSERPKTDAQKRDQWVYRYSKVVGYDLTPFFDYWDFPYNKKNVKKELSGLPVWEFKK